MKKYQIDVNGEHSTKQSIPHQNIKVMNHKERGGTAPDEKTLKKYDK